LQPYAARFNADGTLDTTFGLNGRAIARVASRLAVDGSGRVLLAGELPASGGDMAVAVERLRANGTLDLAFGTNGVVSVVPRAGTNSATAVLAQPDGQILVAGFSTSRGQSTDSTDFVVARLTPAGMLDPAFNQGSPVLVDIAGHGDFPDGVALQSDGKIVVAGEEQVPATGGNEGHSDFALARLTTAGTLDADFGTGGRVVTNFGGTSDATQDAAVAVLVQADGRIVAAGTSSNRFAAARYFGGPPMQFTGNGTISGTVFHDVNGNGTNDGPAREETALATWTVYLDLNRNGRLDSGEPSTTTGPDGTYRFTGLSAGTYTVAELPPPGWLATPHFTPRDFLGLSTSGTFEAFAITDLNGSGENEVLVSEDGQVDEFARQSDGSYALSSSVATGNGLAAIAADALVSDINTFALDVVTANHDAGTVEVLPNRGDGTFLPLVSSAAGQGPVAVATGLLEFQGHQNDLVVADRDAGRISFLSSLGGGHFGNGFAVAVPGHPTAIALGDVNNDRELDVAVASPDANSVTILLNDGHGFSFTAAAPIPVDGGPTALAMGDFNGDGHLDLAVVRQDANAVSIYQGDGQGHFTPGPTYAVGDGPVSIVAGDFNGDGIADLAVVNARGKSASLLLGAGDGTFEPVLLPRFLAVNPVQIASGDLTGDGVGDLAVLNSGGALTGPSHVTILVRGGGQAQQVVVGDNTNLTAVNFGNLAANGGTIRGTVFEDLDGNGSHESTERGLPGWKVYLDSNNNGQLDPGEIYTATDASGAYEFRNLPPGTYHVHRIVQPGYTFVPPHPFVVDFEIVSANAVTTRDFAYTLPVGSISGTVFLDQNGNGLRDVSSNGISSNGALDPGMPGVTVFLDLNRDGQPEPDHFEPTTVTDQDGNYTLRNVPVGRDVAVTAAIPNGFAATVPATTTEPFEQYTVPSDSPLGLAMADFNGDGLPDAAVAALDGNTYLLLNRGDGTLAPPQTVFQGAYFSGFTTADLNGDGLPDLVAVSGDNTVTVLLNDPAHPGQFQNATFTTGIQLSDALAVGDLNHDGLPDLAIVDSGRLGVSVFLSDVAHPGVYSSLGRMDLAVGDDVQRLTIADLNGDGFDDLAVCTTDVFSPTQGPHPAAVMIFPNMQDPQHLFGTPQIVDVHGLARLDDLQAADWNGDGRPDLLVGGGKSPDGPDGLLLLRNDLQHGFVEGPLLANLASDFTVSITVGDFHADSTGVQAVANTRDTLTLVSHTGATQLLNGSLNDRTTTNVALADIENDGDLDLVASLSLRNLTQFSSAVEVLRNSGNGTFSMLHATSYQVTLAQAGEMVANKDFGLGSTGIAGTVYDDLNSNGVFDPREPGVANQFLFLDENQDGVREPNEPSTTTDANGNYAFTNLTPGVQPVVLGFDSRWSVTFPQDQEFGFQTRDLSAIESAHQFTDVAVEGDLNADGLPDVVAGTDAGVAVLMSTPALGAPGVYEPNFLLLRLSGNLARHPVVADLNQDGLSDIAFVIPQQGVFAFFNGFGPVGAGGFHSQPDLAASVQGAQDLAVEDVNGDGIPDLIVSQALQTVNGLEENGSSVLLSDPQHRGTFVARPFVDSGHRATGLQPLAVADFNNDGFPDIVLSGSDDNALDLYVNDHTNPGHFQNGAASHTRLALPGHADALLLGDFNQDGRTDLAVYSRDNSGQVFVLLNTTLNPGPFVPTFAAPVVYTIGAPPPLGLDPTLVLVDWNRDGLPDLMVGRGPDTHLALLLNDPHNPGAFQTPPVNIDVGLSNAGFQVRDVNGDGIPDLVVMGSSSATVSVRDRLEFAIQTVRRLTPVMQNQTFFPLYYGVHSAADADNDGIPDAIEKLAPHLGDGNGDFTPDNQQDNVASLPSLVSGDYVTFQASAVNSANPNAHVRLVNVHAIPVDQIAPANVRLPIGMFSYTLQGLPPGGSATVELFLPTALPPNFTFYKFGPTPMDPVPHWYQFLYRQQTDTDDASSTGAEVIDSRHILLQFVDGQRGDDDLMANGQIVDPGGPAIVFAGPPVENPHVQFVKALYRALLGRDPEPRGLAFWVGLLAEGESRAQVVQGIWESIEHRGLQVDGFYATYLHRAADADGRAFWVQALLNGASESTIAVDFVTSEEYRLNRPDAASFVTALYGDILARKPDAVGLAVWPTLADSLRGRTAVARAILSSVEHDLELLDAYFSAYLHRPPDSSGQQDWLTRLLSGAISPTGVAEGILASEEFFSRASDQTDRRG
jgi:uncharacterized delta-60 repeat protein